MRVLMTLLLALPAPAVLAQETIAPRLFSLPAGCTAFVTMQSAACGVTHAFTCEGDPEGLLRRVDLDEGGVSYFGAIDAETQWIESTHVLAGHSERLEAEPVDRASFSTLLETGVDTYDFKTLSDEVGVTRFVGQDRLTGQTVTIDGVVLDETEYAIRALDARGTEMWRSAGHEFISRDFRMFMSGVSTTTTPDDSWETDDSPMEFAFPGEPGFMSGSPKFGCGVVLSSFSVGGE